MNTNLDPLTNHNPKQLTDRHQDSIVVVCAADNNYAMPLAVTVRSALENLGENRKLNLFIIDGGISERNKHRFLKSINPGKCHVNWIQKPDNLLGAIEVLRPFVIDVPGIGKISESSHIKIAAYYRLLISELLPAHLRKAIYLDTDVVVLGDLGQLWDADIGQGNYLLAVQEIFTPYVSSPAGLVNYRELGLSPHTKYFTDGVMVIDLERWRADQIDAKAVEYLHQNREYIRWHDTDVLNALLAGKWGELDPRWNQSPLVYNDKLSWKDSAFSEEVCRELANNPYIVHFVSPAKPWNSFEPHPFRHKFFEYLDLTDWSGWRLTFWRRALRRLEREMKSLRKKILLFSD